MSKDIKSMLQLKKVIIEKASLSQDPHSSKREELSLKIKRAVSQLTGVKNQYKVSISTHVNSNDSSVEVEVVASGIFSFDEIPDDAKTVESLLQYNAVAILFPYVRSYITTITSNAGMIPIILPPINVNNLENENDEE